MSRQALYKSSIAFTYEFHITFRYYLQCYVLKLILPTYLICSKPRFFMITNRAFNLFLATLPLVLLIGCTAEPPQSTQDKKAELCTNLARFNTAVATLKSMSPSSTVGDFKQARDQVRTTFNDVKQSAQTVQEAKVTELEQAYQDLDTAVTAVPDTATLVQARDSIAPQVAAVEAAQSQLDAGLNCP
jgi:hypothetical protein